MHTSHYGRMCPIETPEGPNIGLIGALATYARVNEYGFIETPYRRVVDGRVTDEIVYLAADDEEEHVIAQANAALDEATASSGTACWSAAGPQGAGVRVGATVTSYGTTSEVDYVPPSEVDLMDVSPKQIVSVSTALIPFIEHDDANRALMGANMQKQAVPLVVPEAPFIGTGVEARAAQDAGDVVLAEGDGTVTEVTGDQIAVEYTPAQTDRLGAAGPQGLPAGQVPPLQPEHLHQPAVAWSARATRSRPATVLADGPSTHNGELALGKNLLVAFMPWEGYNFEDAIILSERLVTRRRARPRSTSRSTRSTPGTPSSAPRRSPGTSPTSPRRSSRTSTSGASSASAPRSSPATCWSGKVTPKGETELTPEERLLRAIFGEKAREVRDTSLKVPHGESGKVIDVRVFSREDAHELPPGVNQLVRVYVAQKRKISEGDKLAGRHGNKGVISKILPVEDMPYLSDGTPVDIILNPLGVPSRMNVGQVLESHLGYAARWGWDGDGSSREPASDARHGNGKAELTNGTAKTRPRTEPGGVGLHPRLRRGPLGRGRQRRPPPDHQASSSRTLHPESGDGTRLIGPDGKATLYNGRTGEPYDNPISVGYVYILKLAHLVDDKIHARSTGPYSMITQQPLGGKAQFGGQRFGEMEVWALEAYGAAYALQELLTIKSDDVLGRVKVYEAIVKGENIPEPGIPESFKVLIKEMQSLCLNVEVLSTTGEEIEMRELDEDIFRTAEELGIDISRPERGSDEEDERRAWERSF